MAAESGDCVRCKRQMVAITMEILNGSRTLRSCSHCDIREWVSDTGDTSLSGILADIATASAR